jgi:hypothetical protein
MSAATIEVRVGGHGSVRAGVKRVDGATQSICDLCGSETDAVVSISQGGDAPFACKSCLRGRLEAITVAMWELKAPPPGLPWGKVSG